MGNWRICNQKLIGAFAWQVVFTRVVQLHCNCNGKKVIAIRNTITNCNCSCVFFGKVIVVVIVTL